LAAGFQTLKLLGELGKINETIQVLVKSILKIPQLDFEACHVNFTLWAVIANWA